MNFRHDLFADVTFQKVVAERVEVAVRQVLGDLPFVKNSLELSFRAEQATRCLIVELRGFVLGKKEGRVVVNERWPSDWWQAFRERWFPAWWLRRWPVQYKTLQIDKQCWRVCPHLDMKADQSPHVEFLFRG